MCGEDHDDFIHHLADGHHQFLDQELPKHIEMFKRLSEQGQSPRAVVIACSDSRVHPNLLTQSGPGDLFLVRNVANLVPPYDRSGGYHGTSAALEYAVTSLEVEAVIVLGHSRCGGVRALSDRCCKAAQEGEKPRQSDFIDQWMAIAADDGKVKKLVEQNCQTEKGNYRPLEERMVTLSLENLRTFPFIREREAAGKLAVHGWYFHIAEGRLFAWNPEEGIFKPL
uniref:Carbonic anhydrase n=1 Tax=Magnetococcus massalia (strain MO-1) TaxID=451514 RepID=A0A1S7LIM5_MAGMO|nr:Carbonic anhydrase [Candidatus Magnetococcus massalia]